MKKITLLISFIFWMIFTLIFTFSIVGMLLFIPTIYGRGQNNPSSWMKIGRNIIDELIK